MPRSGQAPQRPLFFGDPLGALFRPEQRAAGQWAHAARVGKAAVQIAGAVVLPTACARWAELGGRPATCCSITTFGTPRDVSLDALHIERRFPVDAATAQFCRQLAFKDAPPAAAGA
jgi:hypothetical protein